MKGVVYDLDGRVLLGLNGRDEWELPGGRMEPEETPEQCVAREIFEEAGLRVQVGKRIGDWDFEVLPGQHVKIVAFGCRSVGRQHPTASAEHQDVRFWATEDLVGLPLPDVYRRALVLYPPDSASR